MKEKLFKHMFLTSMTVFLLTVVLLFLWLYHIFYSENTEVLRNETALAAETLRVGGPEALAQAEVEGCRITWIAADGTVLLDSEGLTENQKGREEVEEAMQVGWGYSAGRADAMSRQEARYAVAMEDGTVLRVSAQRYTPYYLLLQLFTPLLLLVVLAIILSAVLASRTAKTVVEPLNHIDLAKPDERDVEEELKPMVRRLAEQNRKIHSQMQELSREHKRQDRLRREFTANVSHELKTPLTSIRGFAELIRDGLVKPEDVRPFAGKICQESDRLVTLVGDILKLSRMEEQVEEPTKEPVNLYRLAEKVLQQLEPVAEKKTVSLILQGDCATVPAVPVVAEEMLFNLCDNAVKYNRPGGRVTVTVNIQGKQAVVKVADTGIGIPREDQPRIFERFYRVDKSHSREAGGTGLGLSIVKHGALMHHAEVLLDSEPGQGTTVTLLFPVNTEHNKTGEG